MHHIVSIGSLPVVIPSYHLYGEYEAISQSFYISNFVRAYVCRVEPACKAEPKIVFCARLTGLTRCFCCICPLPLVLYTSATAIQSSFTR